MLGHVDIFLDESGDLGFSFPRSSRYFVVCAMYTTDGKAISRLPRDAKRKGGVVNIPEVKFSKSRDALRRTVLDGLSRSDCDIVWGAIDKHEARYARRRENETYCDLCSKVLSETFRRIRARRIDVMLDRRSSRKLHRDELDAYIVDALNHCHSGFFVPELQIGHYDSAKIQCLQVCDFVIGSVFQMIERNHNSYVDIISERIAFGKVY